MRSPSTADRPAVFVPDAPDIAGLTFRPGVPDDWATLTDVVNRARRVRRRERGLRTRHAPRRLRAGVLVRHRPRPPDRRAGRRDDRARLRVAHPARDLALARGVGRRPARAPTPGHRHRAPPRDPGPPRRRGGGRSAPRRTVLRVVGARRRAVGRGAARATRASSRSGSGSRCGGSSPASSRTARCPPGSSCGRSRRTSTGRSSTPTTRPSATTGAIARRTTATSGRASSTRRPTRRCGAWPGTATRSPGP